VNAKSNEFGPPTERELEILKILWERGRASVREVYEEMRRSAPIVQNTVQAFLRTMEDKGLVRHEVEGRTFVEGEFVDTVTGIPDSRSEIVMLRPPDGGTAVELSSFVTPDHEPGSPTAMANELGLRNVCFEVEDLQAAVDAVTADGYALVGGLGEHENTWRMAYVRGPEGILVSLAERIADPRVQSQ